MDRQQRDHKTDFEATDRVGESTGRARWLLSPCAMPVPPGAILAPSAAMLAGSVLCAIVLLIACDSSEAIEVAREADEPNRLKLITPPRAETAPAAETLPSIPSAPIPVAPVKQRSLTELKAGLQAIAAEDRGLTTTGIERERQRALLRLRMYRFLCHVPEADLTCEPQLNDDALAAADICLRLKKLSHAPENPGLPDAEYERARAAAGKCNLSFGYANLTKAVDLTMNDSDEYNLTRLGHRRWCLNPRMLKLGLDRTSDFCSMWAFDSSRTSAPDYDFISFPPPGFVPVDFFGPAHAWSITLNPAKYLAPELKAISVEVFSIDKDGADRDHPLEIEHLTVDTQGFGVNNCVIFRPKSLDVRPHQSYQLEVRGLQTRDGNPVSVQFAVRFIDAIAPATLD